MKLTMANNSIILVPGLSQVYGSIGQLGNRFDGFQTTMAQAGKPLKRFSPFEHSHTRLKPGANERLVPGLLMKMKYDR